MTNQRLVHGVSRQCKVAFLLRRAADTNSHQSPLCSRLWDSYYDTASLLTALNVGCCFNDLIDCVAPIDYGPIRSHLDEVSYQAQVLFAVTAYTDFRLFVTYESSYDRKEGDVIQVAEIHGQVEATCF